MIGVGSAWATGMSIVLRKKFSASNYFSEADMPLSIACRGAALPEPMGEWSLQQQPAIY